MRFIWFSGEEQGLFGSTFNADSLTKAERGNVVAMLDFDMIASPNFALLIYDGDGSEFGFAGPNGSGNVEKVFQDFFDARGLYTERIPFDGRSDYDELHRRRDPGWWHLHWRRGAQDTRRSRRNGAAWSSDGPEGQFDPCYHLACDTFPTTSTTRCSPSPPTRSPTPC